MVREVSDYTAIYRTMLEDAVGCESTHLLQAPNPRLYLSDVENTATPKRPDC